MRFDRKRMVPLLMIAAIVLCAWCSAVSGVGGWVIGSDLARREALLNLSATADTKPFLPPLGVLVTKLDRTGPAVAAGIERGDTIVALDGAAVQDARDLRAELVKHAPGDRVKITLQRDATRQDVDVKLAAFPGDAQRSYIGVYYTARGDEPADL